MKIFLSNVILTACLFTCICIVPVDAQDIIYLSNPSFEDSPRKGGERSTPIKGWYDCGLSKFPGESPPDIHPLPTRAWGVNMDPFDGYTYLGLVIRYNDTYESVSQALKIPLKAQKCYSFSAALARSEIYLSATTRRPDREENFTYPVILRIWGGDQYCKNVELLAVSTPVDHSDWGYYDFVFRPSADYRYFTIEAYYDSVVLEPYNGHVMVDGLSPITEITCE